MNQREKTLEGAAQILAVLAALPENERMDVLACACNAFCGGVIPEVRLMRFDVQQLLRETPRLASGASVAPAIP